MNGGRPAGAADTGEHRPPEEVVARLRRHGRALFWPAVLLVVVAAGVGWAFGRVDPTALPVVGDAVDVAVLTDVIDAAILVVAAVLLLAGALVPLVRWAATRYTITTRRVVVRSGVLVQHRAEVLHSRGYDVSVRRSPAQRIAGSGDVLLHTARWSGDGEAAGEGVLVLRDVPRPGLVADALAEQLESAARLGRADRGAMPLPPGTGIR